MGLNDILDWIAKYPAQAFWAGCFVFACLMLLCDFLVRFARSLTGKYPAPSPVVRCDCDSNPCYCCRENGCQPGCRCNSEEEDE
jgi:hypothetical protein